MKKLLRVIHITANRNTGSFKKQLDELQKIVKLKNSRKVQKILNMKNKKCPNTFIDFFMAIPVLIQF